MDTYLGRAKLLDRVSRGIYEVSERGREVLAQPPDRITIAYLRQFPEFRSLRPEDRYPETSLRPETLPAGHPGGDGAPTPEESIANSLAVIEGALREKLLQRVLEAPPRFFEQIVVDLLLAMGYGSRKDAGTVRGRSGDGGLDGVIREDELGLELIYIQAKRYKSDNVIGVDKIREFTGALDFAGTRKGVFITTSRFTAEAERFAVQLQGKRIILVDGERLTSLMVAHGVGVRPKENPMIVREIDLNYFEIDEAV